MKITFICTGNTCRSPMAEGICNAVLKEKNISSITCQSCGLAAYPGDEPSENAVAAAKKFGADISAHRSRQLNRYIADETDLAVCMTAAHRQAVAAVMPRAKVIVPDGGVPDPYGGSLQVYEDCAAALHSFIVKLISALTAEITAMSEAHIADIAEIERLSFSAPWSENALREELSNENAHFLCAVSDNKVLGYIGVHEICGEAYITNVAVHPEYRRFGLGEKLISAAADRAKDRKCEFISLEVRKSNAAAIELYSKQGYNTVGERRAFYTNPTEDALIMTKSLKDSETDENSGN